MAVARVLDPQPQQVNINSNFDAHPAGVQITDSQPVKFNNNSGSTISITFANTAITNQRVFNDITNLASGQSTTEPPLVTGVTVNYEVWWQLQNYGPFAIEVGTPLETVFRELGLLIFCAKVVFSLSWVSLLLYVLV